MSQIFEYILNNRQALVIEKLRCLKIAYDSVEVDQKLEIHTNVTWLERQNIIPCFWTTSSPVMIIAMAHIAKCQTLIN